MKVAAVFDSFQDESNRTEPFVFANKCSVITVMPAVNKGVEVAKRTIAVRGGYVDIGAVGWPYSEESKEQGRAEVRAVKLANMTFKCVRNADGEVVPVTYDKKTGMYTEPAPSNALHREQDIKHIYYNSATLVEEERRAAAGQPSAICPAHLAWLKANKVNKKIIDCGIKLGRDMSFCVDKVYFGHLTPIAEVVIPEFYLRTRQITSFRQGAVDEFILKAGRSEISCFISEFSNYCGVVVAVHDVDGMVYVDFCKAKRTVIDGQDKWQATGDVFTFEYPNQFGTVQVLAPVKEYNQGDVIADEHIVNKFTRLARIIPHNPAYENLNSVVEVIGEQAMVWLRREIIKQFSPCIRGVSSIALSLLGEMPKNVTDRDIFMRNSKFKTLIECSDESALVQTYNPFVRFDLLHHSWYRPNNRKTVDRIDERTRELKRINSNRIGDMIVEAQKVSQIQAIQE